MDIVIKDLMPSAQADIKRSEKGGITSFELSLSWEKPTIPDTLTLCFTTECADVYSVWSHGAPYDRSLMPSWRPKITHSRLAAGLPLHQLLSLNGKNRYCVALSDASIPASISTGVSEFSGGMEWKISLFTVKSLAQTERTIPEDVIIKLAEDVSCAVVLYISLKKADKLDLLPEKYASEEYIARSDMTRWLEYPTELGKTPDELEYIGKVTVKKHDFHIFRYRTDSENLKEDRRGKWLIGWSSLEGGTFSPFVDYEKYEKKTVEKTLRHIARKLIR